MNLLELRLLRYFVAVAETEHVGKASKILHVSQSPLSRQIRQLEEATSLKLFERERQRLRLTSDGKWFLDRARQVLSQVQALERDAARLSRGETGEIRIGFVKMAMWSSVLPLALRRFRAKHAGVAIELRSAPTPAQLRSLVRGEIDVALVHDVPEDAGLKRIPLHEEALCLALPQGHPLEMRKRILPTDLDGADWISLGAGPRDRGTERLLAACARHGFTPSVRFTAHDQETIAGLVAAGMGFALLPEGIESRHRAGMSLRRLPWLKLLRRLFAVVREASASPTTSAFVECLKLS